MGFSPFSLKESTSASLMPSPSQGLALPICASSRLPCLKPVSRGVLACLEAPYIAVKSCLEMFTANPAFARISKHICQSWYLFTLV